ncbi:zf-HC2 domain-containing protein, partial [Acinetobacter baumannii]
HCVDREAALNALFDGELDSLNAAEVEAHVRTCAGCSDYLTALADVREVIASAALDEVAPDGLRRRIEELVPSPDAAP